MEILPAGATGKVLARHDQFDIILLPPPVYSVVMDSDLVSNFSIGKLRCPKQFQGSCLALWIGAAGFQPFDWDAMIFQRSEHASNRRIGELHSSADRALGLSFQQPGANFGDSASGDV